MTTDIEIKGLDEFLAILDEMPVRIEKNVIAGALSAAARVISDEAKRLCPVASGHLPEHRASGDLRDSIHVSRTTRKGRPKASIKTRSALAHLVEYGTARHLIKPKNRKSLFVAGLFKEVVAHPGAVRKPFMRPAFDNKKDEALEVMAEYMRVRIEKLTRK